MIDFLMVIEPPTRREKAMTLRQDAELVTQLILSPDTPAIAAANKNLVKLRDDLLVLADQLDPP